ncbi:MAG: FkbM family methyltransferase [Verrucomicrobia bacterium]|nr:FkbM family methyltransferase [Verrucomicrobiota bacterium]
MLKNFKDLKILAKRVVKTGLRRDHLIQKDVSIQMERCGTNYGGWVINPNLLLNKGQPTVMSFGIGDDISFDLAMVRRFGAKVFAFDPTPNAIRWVSRQKIPSAMTVYEIGLADFDGNQEFGLPDNPNWDDFSVRRVTDRVVRCKVARLSSIMEQCGMDDIDILKMDIEGAEYPVIRDLSDSATRPRQLLIEFHHGTHGISVTDTRTAVSSLRNAGYLVFDISPWGREFSFVHSTALRAARQ